MLSPNGPKLDHFFVIFSVIAYTAPHPRTCKLLDPGSLVAHGFQLFEQETTRPTDSMYLCPFQITMLNLNGPKLHHFHHFSVRTFTAPHTRTCNFSDPGGLVAHGFQLFEQETPHPIDTGYICLSKVSILNLNGPKLHLLAIICTAPHTRT